MKKLLLFAALFVFNFISFSQCNIFYVTTAGIPSATGAMNDPLDLVTAVSTANDGDLIRIGIGNYIIDNSLTIPYDNIILEGGFDDFNAWKKSSLAGATTITRSSQNAEGSVNDYRLVTIYADAISGFELHDLTITTENGIAPGTSTYGLHIQNCTNYSIVRCQVTSGNASNGTAGTPGQTGASGDNGLNGANGSIDTNGAGGSGGSSGAGGGTLGGNSVSGGTNPAGNGNTGGSGPAGQDSGNLRDGGSGGGGGAGGETDHNGGSGGSGGGVNFGANQTGGGGAGSWGDPGGDGGNGFDGQAGAAGSTGANGASGQLNMFYVTGPQAASGTDGNGGKGGVGGGGGGGQSCFFCDDGSGDGGGGGGGGGQGGTAGTGGFGGGSSFGIYIYSNGINGSIENCNVSAGNAGQGGLGGQGGQGGNGSTYGTSEVGEGGDGGDGGAGGNGGDGGDGANGVSAAIQFISGDALLTQDDAFDLASQPEITVDYASCTNESMSFRDETLPIGSGTAAWDFGSNASTQTSTDNPATTSFVSTGMNDVTQGANIYLDFINITCSVDASATQSGAMLSANANGATYQWVDCNVGYFPINGETSQTYTPAVTGDYAVIVTEGSCTDTSACFNVDYTGLSELTDDMISVYPNPTSDRVNISFGVKISNATLKVFDIAGQLIYNITLDNVDKYELDLNAPNGVYNIQIVSDQINYNQRLIKQ